MKFLLSLLVMGVGLSFTAAASEVEAAPEALETEVNVEAATVLRNECVSKRMIRSFSSESRDSIILRAGRADYRLTSRFCRELSWARSINFDTRPRNSAWVCRGDHVLIVDQFNGRVIERCWIDSIERL